MKRLLAIAAVAFTAASLSAYRPYEKYANSKAAWMTVSSIKTGQGYYLEVSQDGQALMREETAKSLTTRRGSIKPQLVKDFFREIDNSEIINSQNVMESKMVFYQGELMRISAYISGELTRTEAPLNKFGEAFSYAFGEVKKAVAALPQDTAVTSFLRAEPLKGEALQSYKNKASLQGELKTIETEDIMKIKPLLAAIKEPYRLIPIENKDQLKELQDFISSRQLYGLRTLFYLPSTRGTFKCQLLEVWKKPAAVPETKPAAAGKARKKAGRKK